ncbi:MAG: hypothetical protein AMS23_10430 [Bacteroides sp. SM1_62]|nr:MAG: hypothetical protein AMS23_10430 [Bacteroides sp. SM1_62]
MKEKILTFLLIVLGVNSMVRGQYEDYLKKIGTSAWTSYVMYADPDGNLFFVNGGGGYLDLMKYDLDLDQVYKVKDNFIDDHDGYNGGFGSIAPTAGGDTVYCMTTAGTNHGNAEIFRLICSQDKLEYVTDICGTNLWMIFNMTLSQDGKALYYIANNTPSGKGIYKIGLDSLDCSKVLDLDAIIPHRDLCFGGINVWDKMNNFYVPVWSWDYDEGDLALLKVHVDGDVFTAEPMVFTDDGSPFGDPLLPGFRHHSCWSGIGASSSGNIYIGASNHYQTADGTGESGNVAMYKYDPVKDEISLLGDLESVSKSVNNWMPHESQHKVHTFLIENVDKKIYFATMDYAPSYLVRGSHIYTIDIETDEITDYSKTQTYLMDRNLNTIKNGTIPATNSGVFTEYYAIKGIALNPGTPDILYAMTYARSASGSGWDVEPGNIIRYKLEGDFVSTRVISTLKNAQAHIYPNPFRDKISFHFSDISLSDQAVLRIYDLYGRILVEEKVNNTLTLTWDGTDVNGLYVPAGVYIYQIDSKPVVRGKIMKVK